MKVTALIFSLALFISSCIRYDKLKYYTPGFVPKTSCVKTEGYYLTTVPDMPGDTALQSLYFYDDGSFLYSSKYYDTLEIENGIKNYPNSFKKYWGFYQCEGDSVFIEWIYRDDNLSMANRIDWKGKVGENNILKMDKDGWGFAYDYNFMPSNYKPDSTLNWLKTHRKYRLDSLDVSP